MNVADLNEFAWDFNLQALGRMLLFVYVVLSLVMLFVALHFICPSRKRYYFYDPAGDLLAVPFLVTCIDEGLFQTHTHECFCSARLR